MDLLVFCNQDMTILKCALIELIRIRWVPLKFLQMLIMGPSRAELRNNTKLQDERAHQNLIKSFVMIKRSAALANRELNALDEERADAIVKACDEIMAGKLLDQFLIEEINSGAGTAFNMNVNEVIANRDSRNLR